MSLPLDDPRPAPSERDGLVDYLEYYRQVLRRKVDGLSSADLNRTVGASTLTLGGIIKHLSLVEYSWFLEDILGGELPEPFATIDWRADPDWDFHSAADDSLQDLLDLHETACTAARRVLDGVDDLDQELVRRRHGHVHNVRWVLIHMIEEYARHAGHADLIRESIDGSVGD